MQVQDDARALGAGRRQCPPPEGGQEVVGVDDPRAGASDRVGDLLGVAPAAQEPGGGTGAAVVGAVALEELHLLAEVLAREPGEVADDALLPARDAVAVVQDEDHAGAEASLSGGHGPPRRHHRPHPGPPVVPRRGAALAAPAGRRCGRRAARRPRRAGPRLGGRRPPPRRPRGGPRRAARSQRRPQHRGRRDRRGAAGVRRRRRRGAPGLAARAPGRRRRAAGRLRRAHRPRPRPLRGPPAARVRA